MFYFICNFLPKVSCDDAQSVVKRQEKVMSQLEELKKQLAGIRSTLGLCQKGPQHTSFVSSNNGGLREVGFFFLKFIALNSYF